MKRLLLLFLAGAIFIAPVNAENASSYAAGKLTAETKTCIECHKDLTPAIVQQWQTSRHFLANNVGCYECHKAEKKDVDAFEHNEVFISTIVSPKDCARCHQNEANQFGASHHSKAARILGSLDNRLAEVVEGNRMMKTPGFPAGVSAAVVSGCWQCHGSEVKVLADGKLDSATWPNTGIGRINPDGSEGSCSACHSRHRFSIEQARNPENCGRCHMGPDHPQMEIYEESKHGIAFNAYKDRMNLDSKEWIVGQTYSAAPTCATCHMSATLEQGVTHDVGMRISWNNRPVLSIRPEVSDAKLNLSGKDIGWKKRRDNMKNVCSNCHIESYINNFYIQYDSLIELYNEKFAKPGSDLMTFANPLLKPVEFGNKIDFIWYEIWHHEGRRARHGASMMGPDYTHWHGTYEVAKHFYVDFIPELERIAEENINSGQPERVRQAHKLRKKIDEVLQSDDHKWYINKMDPKEETGRKKAQEEFKRRYQ